MPGVLRANPRFASCQVFADQILSCCNVPQRNETVDEFNQTFPVRIRQVVQIFSEIEATDFLRNRITQILSQQPPYQSIRTIRRLAEAVISYHPPRERTQTGTDENNSGFLDVLRDRGSLRFLREESDVGDRTTTTYYSLE